MDDSNKRALLAERVAGRRRELADRAPLDPRLRTLAPGTGATRSPLTLALLAALGALALVACAALAVGVVLGSSWLRGTLSDPTSATQSFLGAMQTRDYDQAYSMLSQSARRQQSQAAFEGQFTGYDTIQGPITDYSLSAPAFSKGGATATVNVTLHRQGSASAPQYVTLTLVKESDTWRVAAITVKTHASALTE
jgi:hypothetical protein